MSRKCSECPVKDMSKQFDLINSFVHSVGSEKERLLRKNLKKKHYFAETFRLGSTVVSVLNLRIKQIKNCFFAKVSGTLKIAQMVLSCIVDIKHLKRRVLLQLYPTFKIMVVAKNKIAKDAFLARFCFQS